MTPGIYKHYKGGRYQALMVAQLSEDRGCLVVVYRSLSTGDTWVRPLRHDGRVDAWEDKVRWPDGEVRQRFELETPQGGDSDDT
jgi:hypothetical protein